MKKTGILICLFVAIGMMAQSGKSPTPMNKSKTATKQAEGLTAKPMPSPDRSFVTQLQDEENIALEGESNFQHKGSIRDPFIPLVQVKGTASTPHGPRGDRGKRGTLQYFYTEEVLVEGIIKSKEGVTAWFQGTDNKPYKGKVGDSLADGKIIQIDSEHGVVYIQQKVDDPTAVKPFRDIILRLRPERGEG